MNIKLCYISTLAVFVLLIRLSQGTESTLKMVENKNLNIAKETPKSLPSLKLLEKRTFKLAEKFIIPMLMGGLLKVATVIPIIAVVSTFIGTISLIGSKISLLISLLLGVRALLSLIPPAPKEPPSFSEEELYDLHHILSKHPNSGHWDSHGHDDFHGFHDTPSHPIVYYPEPYIHTTAPDMHVKEYNDEDHIKVAGAHMISRLGGNMLRRQGNAGKILATSEMAAKANAILEQQTAENPNGRVGVKITKTVVKQSG